MRKTGETLCKKRTEAAFYIGPVLEIREKRFSIRCYDAAGEWESEYRLNYKEVCGILLDGK